MELNLKQYKKDLFIKTILWNTLIAILKDKKNIDIEKYLISIKLNGKNIIVKTNKPILNSDFLIFDDEIKKVFYKKVKSAGIKNESFNIKYI